MPPYASTEIDPYEALNRRMESRYLPGLIAPVYHGMASKLDSLTEGLTNAFGFDTEEDRARQMRRLKFGAYSTAAWGSHTASAIVENASMVLNGITLGALGIDDIGDRLTAELQQEYRDNTGAAAELIPDPSLADLVVSGLVQAPAMVAEGMMAAATMGPFGLAAVMANRASRDPETGDFTGAYETAKGAAIGGAMHGLGAHIQRAGGSAVVQASKAAGGFGALTTVEGGSLDEITASAILGGALQGGFANRGAAAEARPFNWESMRVKRKLEIDYNDWRTREGKVGEHEYDVPLPPGHEAEGVNAHTPPEPPKRRGQGLEEAEAEIAKPDPRNETGTKRPQDPDESATSRAATEPHLDEGYPAIALPGQPTTQWQRTQINGAVDSARPILAWTEGWEGRFWNEQARFENPGDAHVALMREIELNGGVEAWARARSAGRSGTDPVVPMEQVFAEAETRLLHLAGLSNSEIVARRQRGVVLSPAEIAAGDTLLTLREWEFADAGARLKSGKGDHGDLALATDNLVAAGYSAVGALSEAGRTLGMGTRRSKRYRRELAKKAALEKYGPERLEEIMESTSRLADEGEMLSVLRTFDNVGQHGLGWDAASIWMAGLLSGPSTWRANISSNTLMTTLHHAVEQPIDAVAGMIKAPVRQKMYERNKAGLEFELLKKGVDKTELEDTFGAREKFGETEGVKDLLDKYDSLKDPSHDRVYMQEVMAQLYGIVKGAPFALDATRKAWETGGEFTVKGLSAEGPIDMVSGRKDWWPFRNLTAQDAMFKGIGYSARMYGLGMRDAIHQGVPIEHRYAHASKFVRDIHQPPPGTTGPQHAANRKYMMEAMERAQYLTFTGELGRVGKALSHLSNSHPAMKGVLTFIKTPANVTKEGFHRIPVIGLVAPKMYNSLLMRETATTQGTHGEQTAAISKIVASSMLAAGLWSKIWEGEITGASALAESDKEIARSQGFQPFSRLEYDLPDAARMLVGGEPQSGPHFVSYARNEPLATPIAMMSTMADWARQGKLSTEHMEEWGQLLAMAMAENIVNKSVMQSPAKAAKAFSEPQRGLTPWVENMVGSVIPALPNAGARARDIYRRDQTGIPEALYSRIPGMRESLPIMYDLVGRPYKTGIEDAAGMVRIASEFTSPLTPHPVLTAMSLSGAQVSRVPLYITLRKDDFYDTADPHLAPDSMLMRKQMRLDMTPHQREYVNQHSNKTSADELAPFLPTLMRSAQEHSQKYDIDVMQRYGVRPEAVQAMRAKGITSATLWNAMRADIESTYTYWRKFYRAKVIEQWRQEGRLRKELNSQLRLEGKGLTYRRKQQETSWQ